MLLLMSEPALIRLAFERPPDSMKLALDLAVLRELALDLAVPLEAVLNPPKLLTLGFDDRELLESVLDVPALLRLPELGDPFAE